jgi:hypothetical protein
VHSFWVDRSFSCGHTPTNDRVLIILIFALRFGLLPEFRNQFLPHGCNKMNFDQSTQAKDWMFDRDSLLRCKQEAALVTSLPKKGQSSKVHAKSFACGFQQRSLETSSNRTPCMPLHASLDSTFSATVPTCDQDILVHFHSHQIQRLIGPNAIFPELRRSASVLSTAIMLFRRFFLSNSVIDFHPRNIAAASALLAVKVDCERNLEVSLQICCSRLLVFIQSSCMYVALNF